MAAYSTKTQHTHKKHDTSSDASEVPWIVSPMDAWDEEADSFSPRHEASTLELFFDLFFVANLATFTQYHEITNRWNFWSYVAFVFILWTTWFHVVCFDARFARDSVWERVCKIIQFGVFSGLALVGYKFMPISENPEEDTPHWIYRLVVWTLFVSRLSLGLQYLVTTIYCSMRNNKRLGLTLPLALNTGLFIASAVVFGGLVAGFTDGDGDLTGDVVGLYVMIIAELVGNITISSIWTKLSFQATHVAERLGLLGLIIIGEGVIGTTKTITRIMGRNGVYFDGCALIFCIILILVFMWTLYFDNLPKYRFGKVKQQFWMALHFPLHLAILGVVEGAQHITLAKFIYDCAEKFAKDTRDACVIGHLDGAELAKNLTANIEYFKLDESPQGDDSLPYIFEQIYYLGNQTNICSPANTTNTTSTYMGIPFKFRNYFEAGIGGMFQAFDLDIPAEDQTYGLRVAAHSWKVVYTYFWSALILLLVCLTASALLADKGSFHWKRFRWAAIGTRACMIFFSITMLCLGINSPTWLYQYLRSSWVLPTVVVELWIVCMGDRLSTWNKKRRESQFFGAPLSRTETSESSDSGTKQDKAHMRMSVYAGLERR